MNICVRRMVCSDFAVNRFCVLKGSMKKPSAWKAMVDIEKRSCGAVRWLLTIGPPA